MDCAYAKNAQADNSAYSIDAQAEGSAYAKKALILKQPKTISINYVDSFGTNYQPLNEFDSIAYKLWILCYSNRQALNIKPTLLEKAKPESWADSVRLMLEQDGRTVQEIEEVLQWLPTDSFWSKNIQSAAKLREKFEQLQAEIRTPKKKGKLSGHQDLGSQDYEKKLIDS